MTHSGIGHPYTIQKLKINGGKPLVENFQVGEYLKDHLSFTEFNTFDAGGGQHEDPSREVTYSHGTTEQRVECLPGEKLTLFFPA